MRQFHDCPSSFFWEDVDGMDHEILQGEGGAQGTPFMPALFVHALRRCAGRNASDNEVDGVFMMTSMLSPTQPASQILLPTSNDFCGNTQASGTTARRRFLRGTFCPRVPTRCASREAIEPSSHCVVIHCCRQSSSKKSPFWEHPSDT